MKKRIGLTLVLVAVALAGTAAVLSADTLVLRDGRRIQGELVGVQRGVIQFREDRGWRGSRVIEVPRQEIDRIEFDTGQTVEEQQPDRVESRPRPSGLREREVWVAATQAWIDTGIDVRAGQAVYFTTHGGDIQWRRGVRTKAGGDATAPYSPRRPIPGRPAGALIARIGAASDDCVFIGDDEGPIRMRQGGRLFLGINDDNLADNQGAFRVTVFY